MQLPSQSGISTERERAVGLSLGCCARPQPPFDPQAVVKEHAALLKDYKLHEITGDNYSAEWAVSAYKDAGIKYTRSEKTKSALYLEAQTLFARGGISLPDHKILLRELRLLERRVHRSGKDTVDHGRSGRDDHANAVLACAALTMARGYRVSLDWVCSDRELNLNREAQLAFNRFVMSGGVIR